MKRPLAFINPILNNGVDKNQNDEEKGIIRAVNIFSLISSLIALSYIFIGLHFSTGLLELEIISVCLFTIPFILNYFKNVDLAKMTIILLMLFFLSIAEILLTYSDNLKIWSSDPNLIIILVL